MRLKYFVLSLSVVTIASLSYTWQQIEIIRLAYQQNRTNKTYKELLDRNYYLRYNLVNLKSASHLGNKLLDEHTNFEIPKDTQRRIIILPKDQTVYTSRLGETGRAEQTRIAFLKSAEKEILVSAFNKIQDSWPITAIDAYLNKQAQAQDTKK